MTKTKAPAAPYELDTIEGEDGKQHLNEAVFAPVAGALQRNGFHEYDGVLITGVGEESEPPEEFVALGHGHTMTWMYAAAEEFARTVLRWKSLREAPDGDSANGWLQRPARRYAVFICHPHPDHPCGCAYDDTWRLVYVPEGTERAVAVTVLKRPGAGR